MFYDTSIVNLSGSESWLASRVRRSSSGCAPFIMIAMRRKATGASMAMSSRHFETACKRSPTTGVSSGFLRWRGGLHGQSALRTPSIVSVNVCDASTMRMCIQKSPYSTASPTGAERGGRGDDGRWRRNCARRSRPPTVEHERTHPARGDSESRREDPLAETATAA